MSADTLADLRAGRLAGATELRLGGLGLDTVPPEIFALADTLRLLDLGGNALRDLPDAVGRLSKLEVLFVSGNPLERVPPVLGALPRLQQVGLRGCGLREVPGESLPPRLRWLTLTDNAIERMPDSLGERPHLQKLMLAGNRLATLPEGLAQAPRLELIRISANRFASLPPWLAEMPRLAWLAFAGNPLDAPTQEGTAAAISWRDLDLGALLGRGASGRVYAATLRGDETPRRVALKLFHGVMTSDGLPDREMAACLAAGDHPNLAGGLGRIGDHPEGAAGLVMPLLPRQWRALAAPPSLASCSRDVYASGFRLEASAALRIAAGIARAGAHLHGKGLLHGDLYAHNILWDGAEGDAVLSDFGAASVLPPGHAALASLDVLAYGLLLRELVACCDEGVAALTPLAEACTAAAPGERPSLAEVAEALGTLEAA